MPNSDTRDLESEMPHLLHVLCRFREVRAHAASIAGVPVDDDDLTSAGTQALCKGYTALVYPMHV